MPPGCRSSVWNRLGWPPDRFDTEDSSVTVERLRSADVEPAAAVIAAAFRPETFTTAALGGRSNRIQSAFEAYIEAKIRAYRRHNQPLFVAREEEVVGVVLLVRPSFSLPPWDVVRVFLEARRGLPTVARTADPRDFFGVLALHEPPGGVKPTHYDLEYIGVCPDRQGQGIGRRLLRTVHDFVDRDPGAAGTYLATADEWNRDFYASVGYETVQVDVDDAIRVDGRPLRAFHMTRSGNPPE